MNFKNVLNIPYRLLKKTLSVLASGRSIMLIFACVGFFTVLIILEDMEDTIDIDKNSKVISLPLVSAINIPIEPTNIKVTAFAEVRPKWQVELKTEVGGTVKSITSGVATGARVVKGQTLFKIDDTQYLADVADANHALRQSELDLKRAQYESSVAKHQFSSTGRKPPNDLSIHLPQIEIAKAAVSAAQARLAVTQRQLNLTTIKAPFTGYLSERLISPGQIIMAGEPLGRLVGDDTYELTVSLNKKQWQQLSHPLAGQTVELFDELNQKVGEATIQQAGGYLDTNTRHYLVQLSTNGNHASVLGGDLLTAVFTGRRIDNALRIPASALTAEGNIWAIEDQRLQRINIEVLSREDGMLTTYAPETHASHLQIVELPLSSYLPGQGVQPQLVEDDVNNQIAAGDL